MEISIVIATYNSEKTLDRCLQSIRKQNIDQEQIEILVIDGGSTDSTLDIARIHGAIILENPHRLPEMAKRIGIRHAKGDWILIMDSDEEIPQPDVLSRRVSFMRKHPEVKCLLGYYKQPLGYKSKLGHYISNVGDPFSAFAYQWYIGSNIGLIKKHNISDDQNGVIGRFKNGDIIPIGDSVTMFNRAFLYEKYEKYIDTENTATIFSMMVHDTELVAHVNDDFVYHYTRSDFRTYLRKLKFGIINNIFDQNGSGYSAVSVTNNKLKNRKYFYPLYCATIVLPLIDGIRMAIYYKEAIYTSHIFWAWYVLIQIVIQSEFVITDGGSNQEELYYMNKPCLILRTVTERNEGIGINARLFDGTAEDIKTFIINHEIIDGRRELQEESPSRIIVDYLR